MTRIASTDLVAPSPSNDQVAAGLDRFVGDVRRGYGDELKGVFLFGSRARGDHRPDSDADVAIVLADGPWSDVTESVEIAYETFEILLDHAIDIQPRAIAESHWLDPEQDREPWLIRKILADARRVDRAS